MGKQKTTRRQPQRVPPPLLSGNERIDGQGILDEFTGDESLVLWKTFRAVHLWGQIRPQERKELISPDSYGARVMHLGKVGELGEAMHAVQALSELFRKTLPSARVAAACRAIEEWAESRNAPRTALEFAQLAALAMPGDAAAAARVGRRVRNLAEYARAESWYWEAIVRARKIGDWQSYVLSALGLGITGMLRGNYPAARRNLERGLRRARRQGLTMHEAMAYHEMTVLAIKTDNLPQTVQFGQSALRIYGPDHPRIPWLAHDLAVFWMNRGYFDVALDIFNATPDDIGSPADQLARLSSMARAAGATGSLTQFDAASARVDALIHDIRTASVAAIALLEVARGALSLGLLEIAADSAHRAKDLADSRGEAERTWDAEGLLQEIRASTAAREVQKVRAPRKVLELASELVESMTVATV